MNVCKIVLECINQYPEDEPIFIEEIQKYVVQKYIIQKYDTYTKENIIKAEFKGIYYKPTISIFGEVPLNTNRLIELKYLVDRDGNIKGYIIGAKLFNKLGFTTQVPNVTDIVTNECKYHKQYDEKLRTYITKPKIKITSENYKYLQFIDILENKDNINIEVDNSDEILYKVIKEYNLDFEKIIKYARETNRKKILDKLYTLAR